MPLRRWSSFLPSWISDIEERLTEFSSCTCFCLSTPCVRWARANLVKSFLLMIGWPSAMLNVLTTTISRVSHQSSQLWRCRDYSSHAILPSSEWFTLLDDLCTPTVIEWLVSGSDMKTWVGSQPNWVQVILFLTLIDDLSLSTSLARLLFPSSCSDVKVLAVVFQAHCSSTLLYSVWSAAHFMAHSISAAVWPDSCRYSSFKTEIGKFSNGQISRCLSIIWAAIFDRDYQHIKLECALQWIALCESTVAVSTHEQ